MAEEVSPSEKLEQVDEPIETIEELAKSIIIREPRPMFQQVLVSLGFVFGPIMLILDVFFPSLFSFIGFSGLYIFIPSTILFFIASTMSAKRYS